MKSDPLSAMKWVGGVSPRLAPTLLQASSRTVLLSPDLPQTSSISSVLYWSREFCVTDQKGWLGWLWCSLQPQPRGGRVRRALELRVQQSPYFKSPPPRDAIGQCFSWRSGDPFPWGPTSGVLHVTYLNCYSQQ